MSRKTMRWLAVAGTFYVFVLWSAFRWGASQRFLDGDWYEHTENERKRKLAREAQPETPPPSTAESRLNAGGPAFIAVRYDASHVAFMVANLFEHRFSEPSAGRSSATLEKISAPERPSAELAGLQELWQPESLSQLPERVKEMSVDPDKQWTLQISPETTIPVTLDQPVVAPNGCALTAGFLATISTRDREIFAKSSQEYFVIRRAAAQAVDSPGSSHRISELRTWETTPDFKKELAGQLTTRMQQEITRMDASLLANAQNTNSPAPEWPLEQIRPRLRDWLEIDRRLSANEGKLDYDLRAFRLSPDSVPRLFVRARWQLDGAPVFLMSAWFKESLDAESSQTRAWPKLLFADSSWSMRLREGNAPDDLGRTLDFQEILSEFDADHDGWAELIVHSIVSAANDTPAALTLYLYTDLGLVPLQASFQRDLRTAEACLAQER